MDPGCDIGPPIEYQQPLNQDLVATDAAAATAAPTSEQEQRITLHRVRLQQPHFAFAIENDEGNSSSYIATTPNQSSSTNLAHQSSSYAKLNQVRQASWARFGS